MTSLDGNAHFRSLAISRDRTRLHAFPTTQPRAFTLLVVWRIAVIVRCWWSLRWILNRKHSAAFGWGSNYIKSVCLFAKMRIRSRWFVRCSEFRGGQNFSFTGLPSAFQRPIEGRQHILMTSLHTCHSSSLLRSSCNVKTWEDTDGPFLKHRLHTMNPTIYSTIQGSRYATLNYVFVMCLYNGANG